VTSTILAYEKSRLQSADAYNAKFDKESPGCLTGASLPDKEGSSPAMVLKGGCEL
jgi:hypothetical protein